MNEDEKSIEIKFDKNAGCQPMTWDIETVGVKKIYSDPAQRPIRNTRKCNNILLFEAGGEPKMIDLSLQKEGD